jgi:hypothetical protein
MAAIAHLCSLLLIRPVDQGGEGYRSGAGWWRLDEEARARRGGAIERVWAVARLVGARRRWLLLLLLEACAARRGFYRRARVWWPGGGGSLAPGWFGLALDQRDPPPTISPLPLAAKAILGGKFSCLI